MNQLSIAQAIWKEILKWEVLFEIASIERTKAQQHKQTCQDWLDCMHQENLIPISNAYQYIKDLQNTIKFYVGKGI